MTQPMKLTQKVQITIIMNFIIIIIVFITIAIVFRHFRVNFATVRVLQNQMY